MSREDSKNFLSGSIIDKLIFFAIPLAATNILQQLFNSADVAVVGNFAGSEALAAVGTNTAVINLFINLVSGMAIGANVVLARFIGAGKRDKIPEVLHSIIFLGLASGVVLFFLGFFLAVPLLKFMGAPDDVLPLAILYFRIYAVGFPFILLYNYTAAVFRSFGDSKTPLYCLILAGVINLILNLILVIFFHLGVSGVAIATVVSNVISSLLLAGILTKRNDEFKIDISKIKPNLKEIEDVLSIGIPSGLQSTVFPVSNIVIQSAINSFGAIAMAGSVAAYNFEIFAYFVLNAFASACLTFVGQNYGAGNYDRCKKIFHRTLLIGSLSSFALGLIFLIFRYPLLRIYSNDPAVIEMAMKRLIPVTTLTFLEIFFEAPSNCMRAYGKPLVPTIIVLFGTCVLRILFVIFIFPLLGKIDYLFYVYPISWSVTSIIALIAYHKIAGRALNPKIYPI